MAGDSTAVLGKWSRAAAAPRGLRRYLKLGEIDRAMTLAAKWREIDARVHGERVAMVRSMRAKGCSWDGIGWVLGITGEAVRLRYGDDGVRTADG